MSLNKFADVDTGYTLNLDIGADEIKANQISTTNIDVTTINGAPYVPGGGGGDVTNPLSANLVLGGFSIIEPLAAASPSLNIDQLDPAKKIDLKVAGVPKVVVKNAEVELKEKLNMGQKSIEDVLSINNTSAPLSLFGNATSALILDSSPTQGVILGAAPGSEVLISTEGTPKVVVKSTEVEVKTDLNMANNAISNVLNINSGTNINLNPTGIVDINGDVDMGANRILGVPEVIGDGNTMTIRNGAGTSILLDAPTSKVILPNNNLDMNNNIIGNANKVISSGTLSLESAGGGSQRIEMDGTFMTFFNNTINPSITPSGFDVNNGEISNANTVKSSTDLQLKAGNNTGIVVQTAPNDTIIFEKSTNHNGNVLDNVGTGVIQNIVNCTTINGLTPVGGLFSGTSDSLNVAATTTETSILPLTFVGAGFTVPPNGFSVGDCFTLEFSGPFNSNNGDTLTIRLKGGPAGTTLLATLIVPLNASSSSVFQLTVLFQIRNIGAAGVADIVSDADLTYNQSAAGGSFVGEQSISQNNTTFDTTVSNTLDVTAEFSSNSPNNDMTTRVSKLTKTF